LFVAGTSLFIPVHTKGALLEIGDGHAGQGNGEVDITALETLLVGTFQVIVRKDMHLTWLRGETPTHWIAMGADTSLVQATTPTTTSRPYRASKSVSTQSGASTAGSPSANRVG
jgi:acetamidase/formamidase